MSSRPRHRESRNRIGARLPSNGIARACRGNPRHVFWLSRRETSGSLEIRWLSPRIRWLGPRDVCGGGNICHKEKRQESNDPYRFYFRIRTCDSGRSPSARMLRTWDSTKPWRGSAASTTLSFWFQDDWIHARSGPACSATNRARQKSLLRMCSTVRSRLGPEISFGARPI